MSFQAIAWAVRQKLPCTQKIVLVMLAGKHGRMVKSAHRNTLAVGCESPLARGISRNTARDAAFSIPATSFGGSDGMAKAMPVTLRVPRPLTPIRAAALCESWSAVVHQAQLEHSMSSSIDASARQSVSVSVSVSDALPVSFTVLAEAFLGYLHDSGATTSGEAVFIEARVFGLCIAGGINQRNEGQMLKAQNYVYSALGLALSEAEKHEAPPPALDRIAAPGERPGHVYILRNPSLPGLVKIGYTCLTVEDRVRCLSSSTSIPMAFEVAASFRTSTPIAHESDIHALLAGHRMPGREFFSISEAHAIAACKTIIEVSA